VWEKNKKKNRVFSVRKEDAPRGGQSRLKYQCGISSMRGIPHSIFIALQCIYGTREHSRLL